MNDECIEISTEVFRLLRDVAPTYMARSEEEPGPTQRILISKGIYNDLIDRAIAGHKTLDGILLEICKTESDKSRTTR